MYQSMDQRERDNGTIQHYTHERGKEGGREGEREGGRERGRERERCSLLTPIRLSHSGLPI